MKLKKIASLALAGVMAVSMLAGCATNDTKPETKPEEPTVVSGYSATLADKLGDLKDYVAVKDNADDVAALQKALNYMSESTLATMAKNTTVVTLEDKTQDDVENMVKDFIDRAKFTDDSIDESNLSMEWYASDKAKNLQNRGVKDGAIYAVNGAVGEDEAVKLVAAEVKKYIEKLPESNVNSATDGYDYSYVVSASVATKALDDTYVGAANSVIFVAVTVTRTVSVD